MYNILVFQTFFLIIVIVVVASLSCTIQSFYVVFNSTKYFSTIKNGIFHITHVSIISVTGFKNVKFHVKGDVDKYSKKEIDDILEGITEVLNCEKRDILVNGVLPSLSFILVLLIDKAYTLKLHALDEQDCKKFRGLKIDYFVIDKTRFLLESSKGKSKVVNYFIEHGFFYINNIKNMKNQYLEIGGKHTKTTKFLNIDDYRMPVNRHTATLLDCTD